MVNGHTLTATCADHQRRSGGWWFHAATDGPTLWQQNAVRGVHRNDASRGPICTCTPAANSVPDSTQISAV